MELLKILLLLLASLGILISLYFTLATYRVIQENFIESMPICDIRGQKKRIVDTRYGRVFFLPNSVFGMVYYMGILAYVAGWWGTWPAWVELGITLLSFGVVVFSVYLFWSLFARLRTPCRLCIASHLINLFIFGILTIRTFI